MRGEIAEMGERINDGLNDAVYQAGFARRQQRYEQAPGYLRDLVQLDGVAETVDMVQIKDHFYRTHRQIDPSGIVPKGPQQDLWTAHGRERLRG